jgi:hypothetical protein
MAAPDTCPLLFLAGVLLGTPGDASPSQLDPAELHAWRGLGDVVPVRLGGPTAGDVYGMGAAGARPTPFGPSFRVAPSAHSAGVYAPAPAHGPVPAPTTGPYSAFAVSGRDRAAAGVLVGRERVPAGAPGSAPPPQQQQHWGVPTAVTSVLPPAPARQPLKRPREAGPSSGDYEAVRGAPVRARGAGPAVTHVVTVDVSGRAGSRPPPALSTSTSPPPPTSRTPSPTTAPSLGRGAGVHSDDEAVCCGLCGAGYKNGDKWRQVCVRGVGRVGCKRLLGPNRCEQGGGLPFFFRWGQCVLPPALPPGTALQPLPTPAAAATPLPMYFCGGRGRARAWGPTGWPRSGGPRRGPPLMPRLTGTLGLGTGGFRDTRFFFPTHPRCSFKFSEPSSPALPRPARPHPPPTHDIVPLMVPLGWVLCAWGGRVDAIAFAGVVLGALWGCGSRCHASLFLF